jgi:pimeloyl-ACP methyl ester carboxylesterase
MNFRPKSRILVIIFGLILQTSITLAANQTTFNPTELLTLKTPTGELHGTLELPAGEGQWPVVLLIAGSGPTDRDGNSTLLPGPNSCYQMIAKELKGRGIASLRFDKRGVGESKAAMKSEAELRFEDYVNDAALWVELLKQDSRLTKIIIAGHSEGSLIGMLAALKTNCNGFISLAGSGRPFGELILEQIRGQHPPEKLLGEAQRIIAKLNSGETVPDVSPNLRFLFGPNIQPYWISQFKYNPSNEIAKLKMQVLIVQGKSDLQVTLTDANLLSKSKPDARLLIIDRMNHVLKKVANLDENAASYYKPDFPLADGFHCHTLFL